MSMRSLSKRELAELLQVAQAEGGYKPESKEVPFLNRLKLLGLALRHKALGCWFVTESGKQLLEEQAAHEGDLDDPDPDAQQSAEIAQPGSFSANGGFVRTAILCRHQNDVVDCTTRILAERSPSLFVRSGALVRLVTTTPPAQHLAEEARTKIEEAPRDWLRYEAARVAEYRKPIMVKGEPLIDMNGRQVTTFCDPPDWLPGQLLKRGDWPELRTLTAVVHSPVLRPDGTILTKPGYDERTGIFFQPHKGDVWPQIPDKPTNEQVREAKSMLLELVDQFPFVSDAGKAAWLAGLLTSFARFAIKGQSPLFLVDGNQIGIGKTMLYRIVGLIYQGHFPEEVQHAEEDAEQRKQITTISECNWLLACIENVVRSFGTGPLYSLLTTGKWSDRALGSNRMISNVMRTVCWANGKNMRLGEEMIRRLIYIRLRTNNEKPYDRNDFKHPNLLVHVAENRCKYAVAALTLLRGYWADGRQRVIKATLGSFESWSDLVRQCVCWLGMADPCATQAELAEDGDPVRDAMSSVLLGWRELCADMGVEQLTTTEALSELRSRIESRRQHGGIMPYLSLYSGLGGLFNLKEDTLPTERQLGYEFRRNREVVINGMRLVKSEKKTNIGWAWSVIGEPATHDDF